MWIKRDLELIWEIPALPVKILRGVRQCGKSSLLGRLARGKIQHVSLDDLQARQTANTDPNLFFEQYPWPVIIDEVQYAPPLFSEIKLRVDQLRRHRSSSFSPGSPVWMTGSNQILLDRQIRESLAGRASYFTLHTLSIAELRRGVENFSVSDCFLKGGWPELYLKGSLNPADYLNDYILTYIEKDIIASAGVQKTGAFEKALGLFGARAATPLNASEIAGLVGVQTVTIQDWLSLLQRNLVVHLLPGYFKNLSKRLIKTHRLYFLDTGLAARLQGWNQWEPLVKSPHVGLLFENLVLSEIVKTRDFFRKDWDLYYWRTKEGEEIDFLIEDKNQRIVILEAKYAVQSVSPSGIPSSFKKFFPQIDTLALVTFGGERKKLGRDTIQVPIVGLRDYLLECLG